MGRYIVSTTKISKKTNDKNTIKREREKLEKDKQRFLNEKRNFEKELRKLKPIPKQKIKSKTPSKY